MSKESIEIIPIDSEGISKEMTFLNFDDIPPSTRTFIIVTNIAFEIEKLYKALPIVDYVMVPKRRGRKKKTNNVDMNKDIPNGSIISLEFKNEIRGVVVKKKKKKESGKSDYFRNAVSIVMIVDGKRINSKVSRNGKFQMTGCKNEKQAEQFVSHLWNHIKHMKDVYVLEGKLTELYIPAMRNINFKVGFKIDREKLDKFINTKTRFISLLEAGVWVTGVNMKMPITKKIEDFKIKRIVHDSDNKEIVDYIPYGDYLATLPKRERQKKIDRERHTTFLAFQSGTIICSSMCEESARETYYEFVDIVKKHRDEFEEKIVPSDRKDLVST